MANMELKYIQMEDDKVQQQMQLLYNGAEFPKPPE